MVIDEYHPVQQYPYQEKQKELLGIPYDTRPMEAYLQPGQKVVMHGGIFIMNSTSHVIFIRENFFLYRGGYHLSLFDQATGTNLISYFPTPMNVSYAVIQSSDGQCVLQQFEGDGPIR